MITVAIMILIILLVLLYPLSQLNPLIFPTPTEIFMSIESINAQDITITVFRAILAFMIGAIFGIIVGIILGYYEKAYLSIEFFVEFLRSLPIILLFPLFLLVFGIGDISKILLSAFACCLVVLVATVYGVRHANKSYWKIGKLYKTSPSYFLADIIFPGALPNIFAGLRIAASLSLFIVLVTEMFMGSNNGLGHSIISAQLNYNTGEMYLLIIIAGSIGYGISKTMHLIERKIIHWT